MQANIARLNTDRTKVQEVYANANGALLTQATSIPYGTQVVATSGNVANATATATLAASAGLTNYVSGIIVTATGATAASVVNVTLTNLIGGVNMNFAFAFPAGATVQATPLIVMFPTPIPANAANLAIVCSVPAGGAGNTNTTANIFGFRL